MSTITAVQHKRSTNVPVSLSTKHLSIAHLNTTNPGLYLNLPTPLQEMSLRTNFISYFIYISFFLTTTAIKGCPSHSRKSEETISLTHMHTQATGFVCLFKVTVLFPPFIWSSNESAKSGWIRLSFFHRIGCDVVVQSTHGRASLRDAN